MINTINDANWVGKFNQRLKFQPKIFHITFHIKVRQKFKIICVYILISSLRCTISYYIQAKKNNDAFLLIS